MTNYQPQPFNLGRTLKRYFVSGFVVVTFVAYALHERSISPDTMAAAPSPKTQPVTASNQSISNSRPAPTNTGSNQSNTNSLQSTVKPTTVPQPTAAPKPTIAPQPTATPVPQAVSNGQYKDGTYTGPQVDVFYGIVQVQATVQNGQISDVQFLQFPQDRRTSQRINSFAVPTLQREALQAQSANVNIISGATLTSEGFAMSLDNALATAKN